VRESADKIWNNLASGPTKCSSKMHQVQTRRNCRGAFCMVPETTSVHRRVQC